MEDLIVEPKRSDDQYFYYDWPVIGDVAIPKATVEKFKDDPSQINKGVVEAYAEWLTDKDIDLSSLDAFTNTFQREVSSSIRGGVERVSDKRTTTYEDDLIDELYSTMNSGAWWAGLISGALADPVTLPAVFLKLFKLGQIGSGIATGSFGGFLQPDREEWGTSTAMNVGAGAGAGGVLGAIGAVITKRLGVDTLEQAQKVFDEGGAEVAQIVEKEVKQIVEQFADKETKALANQQIDSAQARSDFENNLATQQALTEEMQARQYGEDFNANLTRIQNAEKQRISDEFNTNLQRNQIEAQQQAFLNNIKAANERANVADAVRSEMASAIESRLSRSQNVGTVKDAQDAVNLAKRSINQNRQTELKMREGKRVNLDEETLLSRRAFWNDNLEKSIARLEEAKRIAEERRNLAKLKSGKETPELKAKVDETLATMVRKEARPIPEVRPPEAPRNIQTVAERQLPQMPSAPQMVQGQQQAFPAPTYAPTPMKPPVAPSPVAQATQAAQATPVQQAPQQPSAIAGLFNGQSMGAARVNPLAMPSGAAEAATMNTATKAAQARPNLRQTTDGVSIESLGSRAQQVRNNAMRETSEPLREMLRADGYTGKVYDFDQMDMNANDISDELLERMVNEGTYHEAGRWLSDRLIDTDGQMTRIPTPAEAIMAARIAGVATQRMVKLQGVARQVANDGDLSDRSVRILSEMQASKNWMEEMNELANIKTMNEAVKTQMGIRLSSLKAANKQYVDTMNKLAKGDFVNQLFFGVDC